MQMPTSHALTITYFTQDFGINYIKKVLVSLDKLVVAKKGHTCITITLFVHMFMLLFSHHSIFLH